MAGVTHQVDPRLVRGLDYYVRTTFEAITGDLGAQDAVAGGGRYDGLVEQLGGPAQGGIGFGAGLERLALLLPEHLAQAPGPELFIATLGEAPHNWAFAEAQRLRAAGLWVEVMSQDKSLKSQMRWADKLKAKRVLIVGESELAVRRAALKDMDGGGQHDVPLDELLSGLTSKKNNF
jgi:histidyl-tRNA synthetase